MLRRFDAEHLNLNVADLGVTWLFFGVTWLFSLNDVAVRWLHSLISYPKQVVSQDHKGPCHRCGRPWVVLQLPRCLLCLRHGFVVCWRCPGGLQMGGGHSRSSRRTIQPTFSQVFLFFWDSTGILPGTRNSMSQAHAPHTSPKFRPPTDVVRP